MLRILIISLFFSTSVHSKLLDKIVAVINDELITLSDINRIKSNIGARSNISPIIYKNKKYSTKQVLNLIINRHLIRAKLAEMGYVINDDQVESQIKSTEKRLGLGRRQLLNFLKGNNLKFEEYFEIIRETIEYNLFTSRIVAPLVSITDQEIKNYFYRKNIKNKLLSFKYTLVDFSISKNKVNKNDLRTIKKDLTEFQRTGVLKEKYSSINTNVLGDIQEDGLTKNLQRLLKKTDEGSFSDPILIGNEYHIFFVKNKDLVESEIFSKSKDRIRQEIFIKSSENIKTLWFKREEGKHYIKKFL